MASQSHLQIVTRDACADRPSARATAAAQRQRAYRHRRKRDVIDAIGNETAASRVTLLALLAHQLATLDSRDAPANMLGPTRNVVRRVLNEIVTRYAIEL